MRSFDMVSVTMMRRRNNFLSLEVPGLAERRPSLVYGDFIFVQCASDDQTYQVSAYSKVYIGNLSYIRTSIIRKTKPCCSLYVHFSGGLFRVIFTGLRQMKYF